MPPGRVDQSFERLSILWRFFRCPPLGSADAGEIDPVEKHRELRPVELRAERALAHLGDPEPSLLESLIEEDEAAVVPGEDLDAIAALRDENEEVTREEVLLPLVPDDRGQAIDRVAHVDRLRRKKNADGAREEQHRRLPQRGAELGDVADVDARGDAEHESPRKGDLDESHRRPRLRRGGGYHLDGEKLRRRIDQADRGTLGLFVEPILERAERNVVLGYELLLRELARLKLGH